MALLALALVVLGSPMPVCASPAAVAGLSPSANENDLPDAPAPMPSLLQFGGGPGSVGKDATSRSIQRQKKSQLPENSLPDFSLALTPGSTPQLQSCIPNASSSETDKMSCAPSSAYFPRYLKNSLVAPLTPKDKFLLATRDIIDPFNLLTIVGNATVYVESDAHGIYGPGLGGIARYSGVSFTEDMSGEYFGTFFICAVAHQDPHYHREPNRSIPRRVLHAIVQIAWTQSDTGSGMFNYANFVGGAATAAVSNTFVPGPGRQGWGNTSKRLALAFAFSPTGNLVTEFVPDIASKINLHVVIFQLILNMVSNQEGGGPQ